MKKQPFLVATPQCALAPAVPGSPQGTGTVGGGGDSRSPRQAQVQEKGPSF